MIKNSDFEWNELRAKTFAVWYNNATKMSLGPLCMDDEIRNFKDTCNLTKVLMKDSNFRKEYKKCKERKFKGRNTTFLDFNKIIKGKNTPSNCKK